MRGPIRLALDRLKLRIAIVTGLTLVLFMIVEGCGQDTSLANGVAACRTDAECPSDYHCATDLTCWHNGRDPVGDASLAEAGGPDCRAKVLCGRDRKSVV